MKKIGLVLWAFMVLGLLISGSVILPSKAESASANDIKFISSNAIGEWILISEDQAQWVITGWKLRVQNIGTEPVNRIQFRLLIWKNDGTAMYSQVHTIAIQLNPQDILTTKFSLNDQFWYADKDIFVEGKFKWNAEIIQVW